MTTSDSRTRDADWIDPEQTEDLKKILLDASLIDRGTHIVDVEPAGDGNMNCTLRVRTQQGDFIVKQSRPWVAKYPSIPAPENRTLHEIQFYQTVASEPSIADQMPKLLSSSPDRYLMILEDLGTASDGSFLYDPRQVPERLPLINELAGWLARLHAVPTDHLSAASFANLDLRQLNHAHIFQIPFHDPPAINLDSVTDGLGALATDTSNHVALRDRADQLGERYLEGGPCLLHGDFFPGSWLLRDNDVFIIDPEFCFLGRPEFDLAVCTAHLRMVGMGSGLDIGPGETLAEEFIAAYLRQQAEGSTELDQHLIAAWAGIEIIRRLLGVAQLPMERSLEQKRCLLDWAVSACLAWQ